MVEVDGYRRASFTRDISYGAMWQLLQFGQTVFWLKGNNLNWYIRWGRVSGDGREGR